MTNEEILAKRIAELEAVNAQLKAQRNSSTTLKLKVSEKGALSVYGLGRFPVTLYPEQFSVLFSKKDAIEAYIKEHAGEFSIKAPTTTGSKDATTV